MKEWIFLIFAILLEVAGTTMMKLTDGFTKIVPSILMFTLYLLSLSALTIALKRIEMGMAYAIWSGVGTVLITIIGVLYFREALSFMKIFSILLIIT